MNKLDTVRINGEDYEISCSYNNLTDKPDIPATAADIGLGNVVNTGDSATPVSGGTTKFTTGGAYTELAKKADTEGYYKDLHVGVADNLFGEAYTDDVFTLRTTAGNQDIASGDMPYGDGKVSKIEGNTVVWNQYISDSDKDGLLQHSEGNYVLNQISTGNRQFSGHKIFVKSKVKVSSSDYSNAYIQVNNTNIIATVNGLTVGQFVEVCGLNTIASDSWQECRIYVTGLTSGDNFTLEWKDLNVIDLTLLGIDNLTTVDEVEQWLADNIGAKEYYEYNPGELIPVKDYSIKSTGFNLWDEQWEEGGYNMYTGEKTPYANSICCKNLIRVLPSTKIYFKIPNTDLYIHYHDADGKFLRNQGWHPSSFGIIIPDNVYYITFWCLNYGTTYNNDICINLSYHGERDGEYEEHGEHTMPVDITKLTGMLNGTGEDVVVFPDGMKKAGTVCDEIVRSGDKVKAIKRIGSVDLGTLTWSYAIMGDYYYTAETIIKPYERTQDVPNIVDAKYEIVSWSEFVKNYGASGEYHTTCISTYTAPNGKTRLNVYNKSFSGDAAACQAAMSGKILYYELITPEEYILDDEVLPIQYRVDDYGIEEVILDNEEGVTSCSPKMTINYGLNAAKTIGDLPHEYISIHKQAIDEGHQAQARHNINAASQDDFIRIQEQLDAINPKVDNDVYVDLGLPSGLLWAKRNIDVTQPDGFASSEYTYDASFFSWGNTEGHNPTDTTFDYSFSEENYATTPGSKLTGNLSLSYDAARVNLGAPWRMPTKEDFQELFDNCDFIDASGNVIAAGTTDKLIMMNSIAGIRLKSKINGNILFFPAFGIGNRTLLNNRGARGYYWASSLYSATNSYDMHLNSGGVGPQANGSRYCGESVRPVM